MITIKIHADEVISGATSKAQAITKSVLVLARLAGVTPANFAKALVDEVANAKFTAKFTAELVDAELAQAIADSESE